MATKALFITLNDLKRKSIISGNTDDDKLIQFVEVAQDLHIQNYLGGNLYDKLQDLILTDTLDDVANELISGDPEVNIEQTGMKITNANRLYVTKDYKVVFGVNFEEVVHNPDGSEKERSDFVKKESNINSETAAIRWTGKKFPKDKAVRMFVFSKKYQLRHTSGLTYDFLFDMAKELHDANALMFVGGGTKGNEPLIMMDNGVPHRAFLEGRVEGNKYMLILHLTNLELKELE